MTVFEYQNLLGTMYREDYQDDLLIAQLLIEVGWAVKRLLNKRRISPFDSYENVRELIMDETKWRDENGIYQRP